MMNNFQKTIIAKRKHLVSFTLVFVLAFTALSAQKHPFEQLDQIKNKSVLFDKIANAYEYADRSPNLNVSDLMALINSNSTLSTEEKSSIRALLATVDRENKSNKSIDELYDESITVLDDSLSLWNIFVEIKKAERACFNLFDNFEDVVQQSMAYKTKAYPDWIRGNMYAVLSMYYLQNKDYDRFISYADTSFMLLEKCEHFAKLAISYHTVGNELFTRGIDTAHVYLEKALDVELKHNLDYLRMNTLTTLAGIDRYAEDYESCLEKQYKVIELAEEFKDTSFIIEGKYRLSVTMAGQGGVHQVEAEKIVLEAQELAKAIGDEIKYGRAFGYLGSLYMNQFEYRKAIPNIKKSIELIKGKNNNRLIIPYLELAACYKELGITDSTYIAVMKSNEINQNRNPSLSQYGELILTDYYIEKKLFDKAEFGANLGLQMAGDYDKSMKASSLGQLRIINEAKGNYKKAYEYFVEEWKVTKEIQNQDLSTKISEAKLEASYDAEKQVLLANNEKEKAIIAARQKQFMYIAGIAALIAAFLGGLYFLLRSKNNEINEKNLELEKLNNVKDQLFQIIGHDLRKPTIAFRNVSKNLNYLIDKGDTKRIKQLGIEIDKEGKNLYNLTDNLLHWALLQKDLLSIKPLDINVYNAVEENLKLFESMAKYKKVKLINGVGENFIIRADKNSLDTIVRNIIDNALKYSTEGGEIKIEANHDGSLINLSVTDSGLGMSKEKIKDILSEELTQSQEGTASEKGSGLGLKIIKSMLELNEGKLDIKSKEGEGSTFTISLPMAA